MAFKGSMDRVPTICVLGLVSGLGHSHRDRSHPSVQLVPLSLLWPPAFSGPLRFNLLHLILQGEQSHPSALLPSAPSGPSPGSPVALPLPCTEDLRQDAVVCPKTLVLCKQKQKDCLYFNPISSEPTNICQTRWAVKAPWFPAELLEQELKKL